jgi:thioredoxin-related protein
MNIHSNYKITLLIILSFLFSNVTSSTETPVRGEIVGGSAHIAPSWFKQSFLDIADDVDEATASNKHVLLFFQLNGCPYCDRMLTESFEAEPLTSFIQQNFDTISINVRGDREIAFNEDLVVTEKELSNTLNVRATPAIVILDSDNKQVVRVNGYRAPERFKLILEYVQSKSYRTEKLSEYISKNINKDIYQPKDNPLFSNITDLSLVKGALMVIVEDSSCYDCKEFYDGLLADSLVQKEMVPFTIVRIDASSNQVFIDVDGEQTTANKLVDKYQMIYRPGVLVFNENKLLRRHDSLTFPHHFKESLRFVAGEFYKKQSYGDYSQKRTEELLSQGVNIDLSRPTIK